MPNKDWYWDRFDVDVIESIHPFRKQPDKLDLSDAQTSAIRNNEKIDDATALEYETRWIDQLYGTEQRVWETNRGESIDEGPTQGMYSTDSWQVNDALMTGWGRNNKHMFSPTWGLDLVRDWTDHDFEKHPVGSDEHYEHQTRGKVDWAHYYDDNAYQAAFKDFRTERDSGVADNYSTLEDFLTDIGDDAASTELRVDFIDYAKTHQAKEEDDGGLRDTWDNKYEDQFDPETAQPYKATYLDVPDLWGEAMAGGEWETPDTPISVVKPASIPNLGDIERRQVEVPDSIKHFGEAKSAPTAKFTAGGQPA